MVFLRDFETIKKERKEKVADAPFFGGCCGAPPVCFLWHEEHKPPVSGFLDAYFLDVRSHSKSRLENSSFGTYPKKPHPPTHCMIKI